MRNEVVANAITGIRKPGGYERFDQLAILHPKEVAEGIREFVLAPDIHNDIDDGPYFLSVLAQIDGVLEVANWVRTIWPDCEKLAKAKICYWAHDNNGMPTELAIELFSHPSSSTCERHLLAAGLASTAKTRNAAAIVLELLPRIGRHEDPRRQESLDGFMQNAIRSFRWTSEQIG
jgi:hypothetical protein